MKTVLTTLSAKFIHSALAIRYLKNASRREFPDIVLKEYTINQTLDEVIAGIYSEKPTLVGFSCYIWNIDKILLITKTLKEILPTTKILLGGPEVSFNTVELMNNNPEIDYIIRGEGETPFLQLLRALQANEDLANVSSLTYRAGSTVQKTATIKYHDLSHMPPAYYPEQLSELKNKIIYYECSRGCPYRCAYCLSGISGPVRHLPLSRVKAEIKMLVEAGVSQIKFIDRTFNCNRTYAYELFKYLQALDCTTNFHFEIRADLLDEATLKLLQQTPKGRFQFEIGVQSTNPITLKAINRRHDFNKIAQNVLRVHNQRNIHQHLDLIAGLPFEDYQSFASSFNDVYNLQPEMLQLGFLKLIKGSVLRQEAKQFNYCYRPYPPYEVLSTQWLSYAELLRLKDIEEVLERYYNSGNFSYTLKHIVKQTESPFYFYEKLADYFRANALFDNKHTFIDYFRFLFEFSQQLSSPQVNPATVNELLKFDFLLHFKHRQLPAWLKHIEPPQYKVYLHQLLSQEELRRRYLPQMLNWPVKKVIKQVHVEFFTVNPVTAQPFSQPLPILFNYNSVNKQHFKQKADFHIISEQQK